MALEKVAARDREMLTLLRKWKGLEDRTIKSCDAIIGKTANPIITTLISAIRNDSEKHKAIIQLILDSMTKKAYQLAPEDIAGVASLLTKHIAIEEQSIEIAQQAMEKSRDAITKQLLKLILEDEKKHKQLADQINGLKFRATVKAV